MNYFFELISALTDGTGLDSFKPVSLNMLNMLLLNLIKLNLQALTPVEQISSGDYVELGSFCHYFGPSLSVIPLWRSCEVLCVLVSCWLL